MIVKEEEIMQADILVVEDSRSQAEVLRILLEDQGYRSSVAKNGEEALGLIMRRKPALVISDIEMPIMDGYSLCYQIKHDELLKDVPVLLLTSLSRPEDMIRGLECKADSYVTKPYEEQDLLSRVKGLLLNRKLRTADVSNIGIEVRVAGEHHIIDSDRHQIMELLTVTFENVMQKNAELFDKELELKKLNEELEWRVRERTKKLEDSENALRNANEGLKKLDKMKSDIVSNVSHELRTPLASIKNAINILATKKAGPINETQERFIKMADRNINRLSGLLNDVLDISKIEAGEMPFHFSEVNPIDIIQSVFSTFEFHAAEKSLVLEVDCPTTLPVVWVDPHRVEQSLCNLLSNSIKFTPEGERVSVTAQVVDDMVHISVIDTGIGMSEKDQALIFSRFYQADDDPLSRKPRGTGLGLAITKQLVEICGGTISVNSEISKGSCFTITLPIFSPHAIEIAELEKEVHRFKNYTTFSLLLIRLEENRLIDRCNQEAGISNHFLDHLAITVRQVLRRESDILVSLPFSNELVVLLPDTAKPGGAGTKSRIEEALSQDPLFVKEAQVLGHTVFGPATYPEDGETGRLLIASARNCNS